MLLPFTQLHATVVASWPRSADEVLQWCGEKEFPMPAERVNEWQGDVDVRAYLLVVDDLPVGYGELWLDAEESEVELARIIIAPDARRQGLGRNLVRGLVVEAAKTGWSDIFMRVHPANDAALGCYRGAGFEPVAAELAEEWNAPQPVDYAWFRHG